MKKEEFAFRIGTKLFPIEELDKYDVILASYIRAFEDRICLSEWEDNVRKGFVEVFMRRATDENEWENPIPLGKFHKEMAKLKFH